MNNQDNFKIDNLFKEKFQHEEVSLEEDYWPFIEKSIYKTSFTKFGWKHFNIYYLSVSAFVFLFAAYCLQLNSKKVAVSPERSIVNSKIEAKIIAPILEEKSLVIQKKVVVVGESIPKENLLNDTASMPQVISNKMAAVVVDTVKPLEKKSVVKKNVYIIQQDTLYEKDTVKVRRSKRK